MSNLASSYRSNGFWARLETSGGSKVGWSGVD